MLGVVVAKAGAVIGGLFVLVLVLVCVVVLLVLLGAMWKIFTKAGKPGWACLIPIYNYFMYCEITGRPTWWIVLYLIGIGGLILPFDLAKCFGKSTGFAVGMLLFPYVFYPMLGYGDARYLGQAVAPAGMGGMGMTGMAPPMQPMAAPPMAAPPAPPAAAPPMAPPPPAPPAPPAV
jgi:hypothetical protein